MTRLSEGTPAAPVTGIPSRLPVSSPRASGRDVRRRRARDWLAGYLFVLPLIALFAVFSAYPFLRSLQLSFTDWNGLDPTFRYIGLGNYRQALHDRVWWQSIWHGLLFAAVALSLMQGISLLLALGVNRRKRSATFYRIAFYLPPVLSGVVVALIWRWIYQPYGGPLATAFKAIGLNTLARPWLADSGSALWAVSAASIWQGVGNSFLLFLAAMQSIPDELHEAAAIDGANAWQRFRAVTLPWITPTIGMVSVLTLLGAMQIFNLVLAMTNGGPGYATEVPVLHIYRAAFEFSNFGYATALSVILGILLFAVSALTMRISRQDRTQ